MKKNALKCSSKDAKDKTEEFFCTRVMPVLYIDQDLLNGVIKTANSLDNNPVKSITQTDIIKYAKNWFINKNYNWNWIIDRIGDDRFQLTFVYSIYKYFNENVDLYLKYIQKSLEASKLLDYANWNPIRNQVPLYENNHGRDAADLIKLNNLLFLSNDLLKSLTLIEYLGDGSKKQGEFNGPDFIFKDNNKTIGIELTYGVKNLIFDPKITDDKKWIESLLKNTNYMKMTESMESFIIEINRIVVEKIKKSEKYKKTDNLILLIQAQEYSSLGPFNPNIQWYWKVFAEIIVNNNSNYLKTFKKIIIA